MASDSRNEKGRHVALDTETALAHKHKCTISEEMALEVPASARRDAP
jgi:hypothetical protein